jgi:hypothetical protein
MKEKYFGAGVIVEQKIKLLKGVTQQSLIVVIELST